MYLEFGNFTAFFDTLGDCPHLVYEFSCFDEWYCVLGIYVIIAIVILYLYSEVYVYRLYSVDAWNCIGVMNNCSSVVLYMYIYTAYDVFYYYFIIMRHRPFMVVSLWALTQPLGYITHEQSSYFPCLYACLCVTNILCRYFCIAHFPSCLLNRFYFLYPLGFVVATRSALRPYGFVTALWALKPLGLSAPPCRWA